MQATPYIDGYHYSQVMMARFPDFEERLAWAEVTRPNGRLELPSIDFPAVIKYAGERSYEDLDKPVSVFRAWIELTDARIEVRDEEAFLDVHGDGMMVRMAIRKIAEGLLDQHFFGSDWWRWTLWPTIRTKAGVPVIEFYVEEDPKRRSGFVTTSIVDEWTAHGCKVKKAAGRGFRVQRGAAMKAVITAMKKEA